MKKITYSCELCREEKEVDELMPYFINANQSITLIERADKKDMEEAISKSKYHICFTCTDIIIKHRNKIATD